jgi:hypothetical protein
MPINHIEEARANDSSSLIKQTNLNHLTSLETSTLTAALQFFTKHKQAKTRLGIITTTVYHYQHLLSITSLLR